jgi:hypothetical protein
VNYPDGRFAVQFNGTTLGFKLFDKIQTVQRATKRTARQARRKARAAHTTGTHAGRARRNTQPSPPPSAPLSWLPSPNLPWSDFSPLEQELARRKAGLRVPFTADHPHPAATAQNPNSTFRGIEPMNPETGKNPNSPFPGINPMNPEPGAVPGPNPRTKPPVTTLTPTKAQALRSTTLANPHRDLAHENLRAQLAAKFGPPPPPPGWRIPHAVPQTGSAMTAPTSTHNPRNQT